MRQRGLAQNQPVGLERLADARVEVDPPDVVYMQAAAVVEVLATGRGFASCPPLVHYQEVTSGLKRGGPVRGRSNGSRRGLSSGPVFWNDP